ncbi:MAG: peptide transporter [Lachnospiraceae bacterium]|nr:peptide transporter [Lachnospiraceae bacterium]
MSRNLIHIKDFSKEELYEVFRLADQIAADGYRDKILQGKTIVLFFPESSIRTRVTFEKGIRQLGGDTILFPPSALDKREKPEDVIRYLENWADAVVVRHSDLELVENLAKHANLPVINAMTSENHPCEMIADMYSLSKVCPDFINKKFLFLGANGNIGKSWKEAAELMGFDLEQCCPAGYELDGIRTYRSLDEAIIEKDIICTDSIPGKAKEDFKGYQITLSSMQKANAGAILNPCPPFYRGEEVSEDVIASDYFVGYAFKRHLLEVQQAIIILLQKYQHKQ